LGLALAVEEGPQGGLTQGFRRGASTR
jgi:hypothetical protein